MLMIDLTKGETDLNKIVLVKVAEKNAKDRSCSKL